MFTFTRQIFTLGAFSSLCLSFPLISSAQEGATATPSPKLVSGLLQPKVAQAPTPTAPVATPIAAPEPSLTPPATTTATPTTSHLAELPPAIEPPPTITDAPANELPATIEPPISGAASDPIVDGGVASPDAGLSPMPTVSSVGNRLQDFNGNEIRDALRQLARSAKISLVVGESVQGTVTMRLENKTAMQAIRIIVEDKSLLIFENDGTFFIKTEAEQKKAPTEAGSYTFSYANANEALDMLSKQIQAQPANVQFDKRTNTIFYREYKSNMGTIAAFLELIDKPTRQVMIEARLVEVTANPKQSYGLNWGGVFGGSANPQTIRYAGSTPGTTTGPATTEFNSTTGTLKSRDFFLNGQTSGGFLDSLGNQFAILSIPQMSITMRLLNEDTSAEFLANPRIVTADNQEATIKIVRSQPVPQLNFNEQTATAVFGGFENKEFGNTLVVKPSINKDDFVSLLVKPTISNKVADQPFTISGTTVFSPIIDTRTLDSNVLIKSGDTLAIGGLLQDETGKQHTKVPILGDIPGLGYLFQEKVNAKTKRNLLVFVTPTIIQQGYGTGLEDQVNGLHDSGEEFADPNGWRNNAKGSIRILPTSNRSSAANIAAPGIAKQPKRVKTIQTITTSRYHGK